MTELSPVVLVVDPEPHIRRFLRSGFQLSGFVVHEAENGIDAIHSTSQRPMDILVTELRLPDMDGAEIVKRIRSDSCVPIIVLSTGSSESEKVRLLELGADDFMVKPFGFAELLARVRVGLRQRVRMTTSEPTIELGPLVIDLARHAVMLNEKRLSLTPKEYRLLQVLALHAGNVVTHRDILCEVWGSNHAHDMHYLRIFVRKLRLKIETDANSPKFLVNELGVGYRLQSPLSPYADAKIHERLL